jgi:hypothetical protein
MRWWTHELKVPETVSLAERTAASMSKGSGEEEEASERVVAQEFQSVRRDGLRLACGGAAGEPGLHRLVHRDGLVRWRPPPPPRYRLCPHTPARGRSLRVTTRPGAPPRPPPPGARGPIGEEQGRPRALAAAAAGLPALLPSSPAKNGGTEGKNAGNVPLSPTDGTHRK